MSTLAIANTVICRHEMAAVQHVMAISVSTATPLSPQPTATTITNLLPRSHQLHARPQCPQTSPLLLSYVRPISDTAQFVTLLVALVVMITSRRMGNAPPASRRKGALQQAALCARLQRPPTCRLQTQGHSPAAATRADAVLGAAWMSWGDSV